MQFDFRPLLRRTFATTSLSADPSHLPGSASEEEQTPGALAAAFGSLAAAFGVCFLRLEKATLGSASKDVLQAVAKPHRWKLCRSLERYMSGEQHHTDQNQTKILRYPSPDGAPGAGGGSPLQVVYVYNMIHNIQLSRNSFANSKKHFREGSQHNMNGLRDLKLVTRTFRSITIYVNINT